MNYPYDELGAGINRIFIQTLNKNFDEIEEDLRSLYGPVDAILKGQFDDAALALNFQQLIQDEIDELQPGWSDFTQEITQKVETKARIILSTQEPTGVTGPTFWYEDKGERPLNFNTGDGYSIMNAQVSEDEPTDTQKLWFE